MKTCLLCQQNKVKETLFDWLFDFGSHENFLCARCQQQLPLIDPKKACRGCGRLQATTKLCQDCYRWERWYQGRLLKNQAIFCYDSLIKEYFERYKFQGDFNLRLVFQNTLANQIRQLGKNRIIVPIPVSEQTWQQRGFNQVEGLLEHVKFKRLLAIKPGYQKDPQAHKKRAERLQLLQPFCLRTKSEASGKDILLVDDVYTTGRTLYYARDVLLAAQAKSVISLTLAR
jgi:competence protein ComFC